MASLVPAKLWTCQHALPGPLLAGATVVLQPLFMFSDILPPMPPNHGVKFFLFTVTSMFLNDPCPIYLV